ncbi:MAG: hypothetical protein ABW219_01415 [Ilumatobacteraceae bacterium]
MKQAWNDVADGFSSLGRLVKSRYQGEPDDAEVEAPAADSGGSAGDAGTALRDALQHLVDAGRDLGDRAADVARDDEIKEQAKRAAGSLNDALAATVDMITEQVGSLFKRPDPAPTSEVIDPPVEATATDAPTDAPAARPADDPDGAPAANDTEARYGTDESPA